MKTMKGVTLDFATKTFSYHTQIPIPSPKAGEVRVRVIAASVNPVDSMAFWMPMVPAENQRNFVPGVDIAGVVDEIGANCETNLRVGDSVVYHPMIFDGHGGFAEYSICRAGFLVPIPAGVSFNDIAVTPCAGWTAYKALMKKMNIQPNRPILITAGGGGVGGYAIQIAAHVGCNPIIATCNPAHNAFVMSLGATHCLDYSDSKKVVEESRKISNGEGVAYIVDCVSSDSARSLVTALCYDGHIACIAGVLPRDKSESYITGWSIHDVALSTSAYFGGKIGRELYQEMGTAFSNLLKEKKIKSNIGRTISLDQVAAELAKPNKQNGKLLVTVSNN